MFQTAILKDEHIEPLAEAVCRVLAEVGVLCQNHELLAALRDWGAEVDFTTEMVRFPTDKVTAFVQGLRQEDAASKGTGGERFFPPGIPGVGTQVAQLYHDYPSNTLRSSCREDFIFLTKLGSMLHPDEPVGHSLSMTDVPPVLEPLQAGLLLAEYAYEPGRPFIWRVDQADYMREMGDILGLGDWFTYGAVCFAHPLRFDRDTAGKFVRRVKEGVPTGITAMPVAGVSTPVTVEGFVVVATAENVATWIAARALNPQVELAGSMWAGTVDMKTGAVSYSAPDAMYYAFAAVEFMRRWCRIDVPVGSGDYCDAKVPGLYTALEKAYKSMTVSAFTGRPAAAGGGLIDEGKALSAVQLVLDREFAAAANSLHSEFDPSPNNLAMPAILEVGTGFSTNHMETEHTLRKFRSSLWLPEIIHRAGWGGLEDEKAVLDRVQATIEDLVSRYEKPAGREEQLAELRKVYEKARQELVG